MPSHQYKVEGCPAAFKTPSLRAAVTRARSCARRTRDTAVYRLRGGVWSWLGKGVEVFRCQPRGCVAAAPGLRGPRRRRRSRRAR